MGLKSIIAKHETTLALGAIILIALALRLYRLDFQSLWIDEISSMNGADPDASWLEVIRYSVRDQPPAFFLLLHGWLKIFPFEDFYGRLLSVFLGIAGIVTMFLFGKEVKDSRAGLFAAAITSFSYIHILFSQDVRFYTLVFLSSALSYLFYIRAVKTLRPLDFMLYALFTALVLYSHYFGLVVFASQAAIFCLIIVLYPVRREFITRSVTAGVAVVFMIIPWIPILFSDVQTKSFWIQPEPFYFPIKYFYVYFKDVLSCLVFGILLIMYGINLLRKFYAHRSIDSADVILLGSVGFSFLIPIIYSIIQTPMLHVRYSVIALPPLIAMISLGFNQLKESIARILLIATCCTSLASLVVVEKYYTKIQKEEWRGMISHVIEKSSSADIFVSPDAWYCNYYFKSLQSSYRAITPEQFSLEKQRPHGVWLMEGFTTIPGSDSLKATLVRNGYSLMGKDSLYRARSMYYQFK